MIFLLNFTAPGGILMATAFGIHKSMAGAASDLPVKVNAMMPLNSRLSAVWRSAVTLGMLLVVANVVTAQQASTAKPVIENVHPLTPQLISGGQPKGDAAFSKLAEMGVKTIVSVDGAKPDLELAKKHGLRYVHIPIGYDGVDAKAQGALTHVMREARGPIFIHCHHGKHRGPAAAAVACMAAGGMTREQAVEFMKLAGTGKEYKGLWRDVAAFKPLAADAQLPPLVEVAQVDSLAGAMAGLDRAWDGMKLCQAAGWKTPANHADLAPAHQALLVWEGLTESRRMAKNSDPQMVKWLDEAVAEAAQLRQSLQAGDEGAASRQFKQVEAACARCHEQYRN